MKETYEEYSDWFDKNIVPNYPEARKYTPEEHSLNVYREEVYEYVEKEWSVNLSDVFYGNVNFEFDESTELTPEEERGYRLQDGVDDMIKDCYKNKDSVSNASAKVRDFLKDQKEI